MGNPVDKLEGRAPTRRSYQEQLSAIFLRKWPGKKPEDVEELQVRSFWDLASTVALDLEDMRGRPPTIGEIWSQIRSEEDPVEPPMWVKNALTRPAYEQLNMIRRRMRSLPDLRQLSLIGEMAEQISVLSNASLLEDLILRPQSISVSQRRLLAKEFAFLAQKIQGEGATDSQPGSTEAAVEDELARRREAMARVPAHMRAKMEEIYEKERFHQLETQRAKVMLGDADA